jgi:hypothetical protein
MCLNVRGLVAHIDQVMLLLAAKKPDILGVVETHTFRDHHLPDLLRPLGYGILVGFELEPHPAAARSSGGICVIFKLSLLGKLQLVIPTQHYCWFQLAGVLPLPLFFAVTYFPQSNKGRAHTALYDALKKDFASFGRVGLTMLLGDMNARTASNGDDTTNSAGRKLLDFAETNHLSVINRCTCCSGKFTRLERGQRSTIDYALCDRYCREFVYKMRIMPQSDAAAVGSDHCALEITIARSLPALTHDVMHVTGAAQTDGPQSSRSAIRHPRYREGLIASIPVTPPHPPSFNWAKADTERLSSLLASKLSSMPSDARSLCSDAPNQSQRAEALELCDSFLASVQSAVAEAVPRKPAGAQRKRTGKPSLLRDPTYRSLLKRRLRLFEIAKTRGLDEEQRALLRLLNTQANQRARALLRQLRLADWRDAENSYKRLRTSRSFWSKLHRLRKGKSDVSSTPIPHTVLVNGGDICTGIDEVLRVWQAHYESTYWLPPSTSDLMRREEAALQARVDEAVRSNTWQRGLDARFLASDVDSVIKLAENGKAPGEDGLPYEFFKAHFNKEEHPGPLAGLTAFFNLLLNFSIWPDDFTRGIIAPIYKKKGNRLLPGSFRPISLLSTLSKLYELLLNKRITDHVESAGVLSEEQAGFRHDRSTLDHVLTLDTVVTTAYEQKQPLYVAFLDVEKAYDRTFRLRLLTRLLDVGITGRVFRSITQMLLTARRAVRIGKLLSDWFLTNCGVPQGAILSPILFDIFLDDIIKDINAVGDGVTLGGRTVSCLLFADDIALLSNSPEGLQRMLDVCQKYANSARFKFNVGKSNVVVFSRTEARRPVLRLNNVQIQYAASYTYLGVEFGPYVYRQKGTRFDLYIKRVTREAARRSYEVLGIARERDSQSGLAIHISLLYYLTHVRSRLEYGCQVWAPLITAKQRQRIDAVQNDFLKHALHLPSSTPTMFCLGELDSMPLWLRHQEQALRLWGRICTMSDKRLPRLAQLQYLRRSSNKHYNSTWFHAMCRMITENYPSLESSLSGSLPVPEKAQDPDLDDRSKTALIRGAWFARVEKAVRERWVALWQHQMSEKDSLRYYRVFKEAPALEHWLKDTNHAGIHEKLLLRAGKLLNTSYPRPTDNPRGLCRLCQDQAAETRAHFLLSCPALEQLRQAWTRDIRAKMSSAQERSAIFTSLLDQWATTAHVNLSPTPDSPTFSADPSHSTSQICALLHSTLADIPLPDQDEDDGDERASEVLKTRRQFETLLEKSTRLLLHKMTKHRQRLTSGEQPLH